MNSILRQSGLKVVEEIDGVSDYHRKSQKKYAAYCPDLPGVIVTGSTKEEALELMKEVIESHLEGLKAERLNIPEPTTMAASIEVNV